MLRKIIFILVYLPYLAVKSSTIGVTVGFAGAFLGAWERFIDLLVDEFKGNRRYPHRNMRKWFAAHLRTIGDDEHLRKEAEYKFGQGKIKAPSIVSHTLAFSLYFIFFLPIYILFGTLYKGPITVFVDGFNVWNKKGNVKQSKRKNKTLILCVDDTPEVLESLEDIIVGSDKYDMVKANSGDDAWDVLDAHKRYFGLAKNKVDCVILDVRMGKDHEGGLNFLRKWRDSEYFFEKLPVILLTGYETDSIWAKATHSEIGQIVAYLKKPVKEKEVLDLLRRILVTKETEFLIDKTREQHRKPRGSTMEGIVYFGSAKENPVVLCVDDDQRVHDSLSEILGDSDNYKGFLTVKSAADALNVLKKNRTWLGLGKNKIDCVILDIRMPGMTGLEFLEKWRSLELINTVPVVLLTGYENEQYWEDATDVQKGLVTAYLKKPFKTKDIIETLDNIIVQRRAEDMIDETLKVAYQKREQFKKESANEYKQ